MKQRISLADFGRRVFDIKGEPMPRGAWWWWFWLFFFDNPKDPEKPRQLMILWSTKNEKRINCNGLELAPGKQGDRENLNGAVAAWYFDGEKMHHDFVLEPCNIKIGESGLSTNSKTPTSFRIGGDKSMVRIGDGFEFVAEPVKGAEEHEFTMPTYHANTYVGSKGYSIIRLNKLNLVGSVGGQRVNGTAYFQRVFVTAPAVPWYWGIFQFENGGILSYFNPRALGKSVKKDITFFDGEKMHEFKDIKVKRTDNAAGLPSFQISGENELEKIGFTVDAYSHSSWTFKKKFLGIIPNKLVYGEYPATISKIELADKKTGNKLTEKELGRAIGNAEHTTGYLF